MKICFLCEKTSSISLYKNTISSINNYEIKFISIADIKEVISPIKCDLVILDLTSKRYINTLKEFLNMSQSTIFVITSFVYNFSTLSQSISQVLIKPVDPTTLVNIINNYNQILKKRVYLKQKQEILISLINKTPLNLAVFNKEGNLIYQNDNYFKISNNLLDVDNLSYDNLHLTNEKFVEIQKKLKNKRVFNFVTFLHAKYFKHNFFSVDGTTYIGHLYQDITKDVEEKNTLKKAASFFEESAEGMLIANEEGYILNVNKAFTKTTGYTKAEILGEKPKILESGMHDKSFYKNVWDNLIYNNKWQGEIWNKRKNGEIYPEWLTISKIEDKKSKEINYISISNDITSIKEVDKKLHFYANYDPLTSLLNRVQFENILSQIIQSTQRNNKIFALLFIDLDNFKEVNDTHGHLIGDILLKTVASRLRKVLRKEDIIARIGGDEFNVILENIKNAEDALNIANKINSNINKKMVIDNKNFFMTFSIGIAIYPVHGIDSDTLTKHADSAMYEVKKNGRNGAKLYDSKYTKELIKKVNIKNELKEAILNNELEIHYQPIYNLKLKRIEGAEALIRWEHKEKGFIPPSEFIPIAETSELIISLGKFIIQKVLEDIILIKNEIKRDDLTFSINTSSKEFFEKNFIENIFQKLKDFNIDPKTLEIEITETHMMKNHELAIAKLHQIREHNIKLAIDDFGTGYSSLSYLKSFPVNKLKIDKSFVNDILDNNDDLAIVKTIITIAKIFNLEVQAEGVESLKQQKELEKLGCDYIQGFYYSKPMALNNFIKFVRKEESKNENT